VSKVTASATAAPLPGAAETVSVIVKVAKPGYVPPGFRVRARIDEQMFTADCEGAALGRVDADPDVVSVALSRKLQSS